MTELWPALLAVVGTLAGVWLGPHLTATQERKTWRRDRKADAYGALLASVTAFENAVTDDDYEAGSELAVSLATAVRTARIQASMWGAQPVLALSSRVSSAIGELVFTRQNEAQRSQARGELSELRRGLSEAIREDLCVS